MRTFVEFTRSCNYVYTRTDLLSIIDYQVLIIEDGNLHSFVVLKYSFFTRVELVAIQSWLNCHQIITCNKISYI